eukprot:gnl/Spiro4/10264_TR5457_c0_g1_i1.p1 gnl/Spiro4/10264_TR5457_c0_g1~~gnl/Spiro4/10264_TR5457_c0_g1_i1.p1  ORF type:complete len:220 (+),score=50.26 gnl/Spiro4/10264_TR5457_c0_g1_i1:40-699(+)
MLCRLRSTLPNRTPAAVCGQGVGLLAFTHRRHCSSQPTSFTAPDLSSFGTVLGGERICPKAHATFVQWHEAVRKGTAPDPADRTFDTSLLLRYVAPRCIFRPPTYYKPWEGRDEFVMIITAVSEVFGPSFRYGRQWLSPDGREWALEFSANIGQSNLRIDGIDLVHLNDRGEISEFTVLARPPNSVEALKAEMMKRVPQRLALLKVKKFGASLLGQKSE